MVYNVNNQPIFHLLRHCSSGRCSISVGKRVVDCFADLTQLDYRIAATKTDTLKIRRETLVKLTICIVMKWTF